MTERVQQRYVCSECGETNRHHVDPSDTDQSITVGCEECEQITDQRPKGRTHWFRTAR